MKIFQLYLHDGQRKALESVVKREYPREWKRKLAQQIRDYIDQGIERDQLKMQKARQSKKEFYSAIDEHKGREK